MRRVLRKHLLGDNFLGPVRELLRSDPEAKRSFRALEIGTRSGTWIQEMATEFSHVQFRSLDIAPLVAHTPRPNIVFEVYDLAGGLFVEDNSQDIVVVNLAIEIIRDYRAMLREIHRVLRPGGLVHLVEHRLGLWDPQDMTKFARATNPLGCRLLGLVRNAISAVGVDPDLSEKLPVWLFPESDLWEDSTQPGGFERTQTVLETVADYPHNHFPCSSKLDARLGALYVCQFVMNVRDHLSFLCDLGLETEDAKSLIEGVVEELRDPEKWVLLKVYTVYGVKHG